MLLQTNLLLQLAEAGKTIAIITPDPEDANLKSLCQNKNIQIYESPEKHNLWDDDYSFKRKYFLEDIRKNPALWEQHVYNIFYTKSKHPWKRIRPLWYYLFYQLNKVFPSIRTKFKANESKYLVSENLEKLIQKIQPKLVVSTYPVNLLEARTLFNAQKKNIPTLIHLLSWDNITGKGIFPTSADYFIVWGDVMFEELKEYYGISEQHIFKCGVPHFDNHIKVQNQPSYQKLLTELGLNADAPYLFMAMSSPRFAPKEIDIAEWLAKAIQQNVFGEKMQLIIRPHPQNVQGAMADKTWLKRLDNLQNSRVAVDYPQLVKSKVRWSMKKEDMNHLSNLLAGCSVCINSGSTVSIDALVLGKPVILTSFDGDAKLPYRKSARRLIDYTHQNKFVNLGGAKPVFSFSKFEKAILDYLKNPDLDSEKRKFALEKECFKNDGKATERAIESILKILK
jgi:CDP-glycerol glycerophosphotransferase (TagB/SpsB family)